MEKLTQEEIIKIKGILQLDINPKPKTYIDYENSNLRIKINDLKNEIIKLKNQNEKLNLKYENRKQTIINLAKKYIELKKENHSYSFLSDILNICITELAVKNNIESKK
jgi:hypothetical protein